ncbi:MAG: hypothetical protein HFI95_12195 [Lachnospiraceae bacterium]|jgi:hypothetical protein|nr:hypothetical protein [Lachnospiraceae bacterium]
MNDKEVDAVREEGYLNDLYYEDRPMKLIVPEPLAKINEEELELSRKKNREMIAAIRRKQPLSIQTED